MAATLLVVSGGVAGCRAPGTWICGTVLMENAMALEEAQVSPYVFCDDSEAELILTVSAAIPETQKLRPAKFYFRMKRPDERLIVREQGGRVYPAGLFSWSSPAEAAVVIQGHGLWVVVSPKGGMHHFGVEATFATDFASQKDGYVLEGKWTKKALPASAAKSAPHKVAG